jgi:hypothetical protein
MSLGKELASTWGVALFTAIIVAIYGIGQYFILGFVRRSNTDNGIIAGSRSG